MYDIRMHEKNVWLTLKRLDNPKMCKDNNLKLNHSHMRTPRVHSHLVAFGKQSLSIGCFNGRPFVQRSKLPRNGCLRYFCLEYDLKTLGLLLRRPNIALVLVRSFRIDPYNSNDGASYFSIMGYHCLKEKEQSFSSRYISS